MANRIDPVTGLPIDDGSSTAYDFTALENLYGTEAPPAEQVRPVAGPRVDPEQVVEEPQGYTLGGFDVARGGGGVASRLEAGLGGPPGPGPGDSVRSGGGVSSGSTAYSDEMFGKIGSSGDKRVDALTKGPLADLDAQTRAALGLVDDTAGAYNSALDNKLAAEQGEIEGALAVRESNRQALLDADKAKEEALIAGTRARHDARAKVEAATAEYRAMLASFDTTLNFSRGEEVGIGVALFFDGFLKARYGIDMDVRGTIREYTDRYIQGQRERIEGQKQVTALEQWQYQVTSELADDEVERAELQKVFALEHLDWGLKMNALAWGGRKAAAETELARAEVTAERNAKVAGIADARGRRAQEIIQGARQYVLEQQQIAISRTNAGANWMDAKTRSRLADEQIRKSKQEEMGIDDRLLLKDPQGKPVFMIARQPGESQTKYDERRNEAIKKVDSHFMVMTSADKALEALLKEGNPAFKDLTTTKKWLMNFADVVGLSDGAKAEEMRGRINALTNDQLKIQSGLAVTRDEAVRKFDEIFGGQIGSVGGGKSPEIRLALWIQDQNDKFIAGNTNGLLSAETGQTLRKGDIANSETFANTRAILEKYDRPPTAGERAAARLQTRGEGPSTTLIQRLNEEKPDYNRDPDDDRAVGLVKSALGGEAADSALTANGNDLERWASDAFTLAARAALTPPEKDKDGNPVRPERELWTRVRNNVESLPEGAHAAVLKLDDLVHDAIEGRTAEARDAAKSKLRELASAASKGAATAGRLGVVPVPAGLPGAAPPDVPSFEPEYVPPAPSPVGPVTEPQPEPQPNRHPRKYIRSLGK